VTLLLALAACGTDDADPLFGLGRPDELDVAEDLAFEVLENDVLSSPGFLTGEFRVLRNFVDDLDTAHVHVQQVHEGVPVFGGEAIVHLDAMGRATGVTDTLRRDLSLDTTPLYAADEAVEIAVGATLGWAALTDDPVVDLWVLRRDGDHLGWRVQLDRQDGTHATSQPVVFVDARSGEVLWSYENLHTTTATGTSHYDGTVTFDTYLSGSTYYLEDTTRDLGTLSFNNGRSSVSWTSDTDTSWTSSSQTSAVSAHWAATEVWDYYSGTHG